MKVLLVGETWISYGIHLKGSSAYNTGEYGEGYKPLTDALEAKGHEVTLIPSHLAVTHTPTSAEEFDEYDVVILSDIPADSLLLHKDTFVDGKRTPNRLAELVRWVSEFRGGFVMIGGYMSFSGFEGKANYHFSPIAEMLPVGMYGFDDRMETPEGIHPSHVDADHPVLKGVAAEWPYFLGYQKLKPLPEGETLVEYRGDPFLSVREFHGGRTLTFASDCSPHWGSPEFIAWDSYATLWDNVVTWAGEAH